MGITELVFSGCLCHTDGMSSALAWVLVCTYTRNNHFWFQCRSSLGSTCTLLDDCISILWTAIYNHLFAAGRNSCCTVHHSSEQMKPHLNTILQIIWLIAHAVLEVSRLIVGNTYLQWRYSAMWFDFSVKCIKSPHRVTPLLASSTKYQLSIRPVQQCIVSTFLLHRAPTSKKRPEHNRIQSHFSSHALLIQWYSSPCLIRNGTMKVPIPSCRCIL